MHQFVGSSTMMQFNDVRGLHQFAASRCLEKRVDGITAAEVRVDHVVGTRERQEPLLAFVDGPSVEGTTAARPAPATVAELEILPGLVLVLMRAPQRRIGLGGIRRDVLVELAAADITDLSSSKRAKSF